MSFQPERLQERLTLVDKINQHLITRTLHGPEYERPIFYQNPEGEISRLDNANVRALSLALSLVISPGNLELSHCSHRAVVACLVGQVDSSQSLAAIRNYLRSHSYLGYALPIEDRRYVFILGYNNWSNTPNPLNCKLMPGLPVTEGEGAVLRSDLLHLPDTLQSSTFEETDNSCPKRLYKTPCYVQHAEAHAIATYLQTARDLGLSTQFNFLTCTWIPCGSCLSQIKDTPELSSTRGGVFSAYGVMTDESDLLNAHWIQTNLGFGQLQGPFFPTFFREPGYGWLPASLGFLLYQQMMFLDQATKRAERLSQLDYNRISSDQQVEQINKELLDLDLLELYFWSVAAVLQCYRDHYPARLRSTTEWFPSFRPMQGELPVTAAFDEVDKILTKQNLDTTGVWRMILYWLADTQA